MGATSVKLMDSSLLPKRISFAYSLDLDPAFGSRVGGADTDITLPEEQLPVILLNNLWQGLYQVAECGPGSKRNVLSALKGLERIPG